MNWQTIWAAVAAVAAVAGVAGAAFNGHLMLKLRNELLTMRQDILDQVRDEYAPREAYTARIDGLEKRLVLVESRRG